MSPVVSKGGELRTTWTFYRPVTSGAPSEQLDPDEFPEGPRFAVYHNNVAVEGFTGLAYTRRYARGTFGFNLPIPFSDGILDPGDYELRADLATVGGNPLVGPSGSVPVAPFTIAAAATSFSGDRFYVSPAELGGRYGVPNAAEHEVRYAQQLIDDWMGRSLWPTVVERERHDIAGDHNVIQLDVRPVIRLFSLQPTDPLDTAGLVGRAGYGRRGRGRGAGDFRGDYMATLAALGGAGVAQPIDPASCTLHNESGQLWLPVGAFLVSYNQVEATYEAGYRVIPEYAKWAVAEQVAFCRVKKFGPINNWTRGKVSMQTGESLITPEVMRRLEKDRLQILR
jgi:hypothetical protein